MARTFVALWPPAGAAGRLEKRAQSALAQAAAARPAARRLPACDLHLTLAFIGELPDDALAPLGHTLAGALHAACPAVPAARDAIAFDRLGSFRGADVTWLGPSEPPPWLRAIASAVRAALDAAGVAYDPKPFVPHLTVARGMRAAAAPIEPVVVDGWRVALARSSPAGAVGAVGAPGRYRIAAWLA